jgi:transcriptional regulator with XRE-family HTH domain
VNGKELKEYREKIGLTQEQLAGALKVASNTVSRWERDDRSIPPYLFLAIETIERKLKGDEDSEKR